MCLSLEEFGRILDELEALGITDTSLAQRLININTTPHKIFIYTLFILCNYLLCSYLFSVVTYYVVIYSRYDFVLEIGGKSQRAF